MRRRSSSQVFSQAPTKCWGRRQFLRVGAGLGLALPLFETFAPRPARAAGAGLERFVVMAQPTTIHTPMYLPLSEGREPWPLEQIPDRPFYSGEGPMDAPIGPLTEVSAPLAPHVDDLLFVEGIHAGHPKVGGGSTSIGHDGYSRLLLGTPGRTSDGEADFEYGGEEHVSLDQRIAAQIGGDSRFAALELGTGIKRGGNNRTLSWTGPRQGAPAMCNSVEIWNRLFSELDADPEVAARLREEKRSVLDAAIEQAAALRSALGRADQDKLDLYLTSFREVESRLDLVGQCTPPPAPYEGGESDEDPPWGVWTELNIDMMVMALACGLTRVATYQVGREATGHTLADQGLTHGVHDLSHRVYKDQGSMEANLSIQTQYVAISRWYMHNLAHLLDGLRAFDLLDSTLCLHLVTMNTGNHSSVSIPTLLAGGGGAFRTGRHIRLENEAQYINDLLVTIARQYGLEVDTLGVPEWNLRGELTELLA
ncbi:MAG: DUF1552 domain-containing protein [Myxococcota bacterium]